MKKQKRYKEPKYQSDDKQEIIRFIIILVVVVVVILGFYLFTKYVVKKPKINYSDTVTEGEIDYSVVTVGTMFNKTDSKYYVLAYDHEDDKASVYESLLSSYQNSKDVLPVYNLDLSNYLNKEYVTSGSSNKNAKTISELAINGPTLMKIEKGKIAKYIEGESNIKKELGL